MNDTCMSQLDQSELARIDGGVAPLVVGAYIILGGQAYLLGEAIGYLAGEIWEDLF